jgi:hypothetical protein
MGHYANPFEYPATHAAPQQNFRSTFMHLVLIAWIYVALMMAIAEATHSQGSLLGAIITFLVYGAGPVTLVMYLLRAPGRRRAIKAEEAAQTPAARVLHHPSDPAVPSIQPDGSDHSATAAEAGVITPMRKET